MLSPHLSRLDRNMTRHPNNPGPNSRNAPDIKSSIGHADSDDKSRNPGDGSTSDTKTELSRSGEYSARQALDTTSPTKSTAYDSTKDDDASRLTRENSWDRRDVLDDRRARYDDRNGNLPAPSRSNTYDNKSQNGTANGTDSRFPPGDRRLLERERERERERLGDRERDRDKDWERDRPDPARDAGARDRERDLRDNRRTEFFGRSYGRSHAPRPPPELRHYEPSYGSDYVPPRRHDVDDRRGGIRNGPLDDRSKPSPLDDRKPPFDDRRPPPPGGDGRRLSIEDRPIRPPPGLDSRALPASSEDRASRPLLSSDDPVTIIRGGAGAGDDRGARATSLAADERPARTIVPLEERISQPAPTPSLQDRLSQPGPAVVPTRVDVARQPSLEERLSHAPVPATAAGTVGVGTASDRTALSESSRISPLDPPRTTVSNNRLDSRALPASSEDRASRPLLSSDDPVTITRGGAGAGDDRGARATSLAADERPARTIVPLEERISQPVPTPSLQDRLSQPGPAVVPTRVDVARQPSLEERLSHAPVPATAASTVGVGTASDRTALSESSRISPLDPPRTTVSNDRPPVNDRFARPVTPPGRAYARSSSIARDDLRVPPSKDDLRDRDRDRISDFRTSRDLSRERPGGPLPPPSSSYRPDLDRSFGDRDDRDRRERNPVDVDAPLPSSARFGDPLGRAAPLPPSGRYSPPPLLDRDRDRERERGRAFYMPRSPPPLRGGEGAYDPDGDRRYAGDRDRDAYEQRRRDWYGPGDDDKRGPLAPPPPPAWRPYERSALAERDRDRYERDRDRDTRERERERERDRDLGPPPPARGSWDDRDRRGGPPGFPPSPPASRMDNAGVGPARSLSARLTDSYSLAPVPSAGAGAGDDRAYAPPARDFDRPRYPALDDHPLPFSRVRGRSPSPPPRRGGPGAGGLSDDMRPPLKRSRDDGAPPYGSGGPTGPGNGGGAYSPPRRGGPIGSDYPSTSAPPRSAGTRASPPPSSGASSVFYDRGGPGPAPGGDRDRDRDRDYVGGARGEYGAAYDRDGRRSPPLAGRMGPTGYARGMYGRDVRDERRYMPPPPPRAS
ncbi:hypothetical protein PAXINDRAFT_97280 [Paxillus involutus ATCC 200175]|nr:hypothetical protein PAXINDRAFT_97280 [Paxillus involutus ATCC 200175]